VCSSRHLRQFARCVGIELTREEVVVREGERRQEHRQGCRVRQRQAGAERESVHGALSDNMYPTPRTVCNNGIAKPRSTLFLRALM
jgi:hypothetical protein